MTYQAPYAGGTGLWATCLPVHFCAGQRGWLCRYCIAGIRVMYDPLRWVVVARQSGPAKGRIALWPFRP